MTIDIRTTATVKGKRTNRVKVRRKPSQSAGTSMRRYRKAPELRGLDVTQVCICMPISELDALDAICERTQVARSHFIRQAVKHFAAKVQP